MRRIEHLAELGTVVMEPVSRQVPSSAECSEKQGMPIAVTGFQVCLYDPLNDTGHDFAV